MTGMPLGRVGPDDHEELRLVDVLERVASPPTRRTISIMPLTVALWHTRAQLSTLFVPDARRA